MQLVESLQKGLVGTPLVESTWPPTPDPVMSVPEPRLVEVATVFGDVADLKTPFLHGHARGVAGLARGAGERLGLPGAELTDLQVAALLHDLGRVAVPNTVWEKAGALSAHEWEQVRLHAYHSERILAGSERLVSLVPLVGMHHERLDGSGYHRGCGRADLPMQARVLAAAGHDAVASREVPAGLTERELDVLALVAEGCTNAQIAKRLVISRRTAEHHVQHIYTKIGASSRAAAALFAMEHDLLPGRDR